MTSFTDRTAVITGGGSGIARELAIALVAEGCSVAICDVNADALQDTAAVALGSRDAESAATVTTHLCDVSDEAQVLRFRDEVVAAHGDSVDLVFNIAGIAGPGSFLTSPRQQWERAFAVNFWGVYYCTRAFLPLLVAGQDGYLVNMSSIRGLYASLGPQSPHTSYATAKFAVRGLTESLIDDLKVNAPHVKVALVMPGRVATDLVINTVDYMDDDSDPQADDTRKLLQQINDQLRDSAPTTAAQAAAIILDGVRDDRWRILVGADAELVDQRVRADPVGVYDTGAGA